MSDEAILLLQEIRDELKTEKKKARFLTRKDIMKMLKYSEATVSNMFRRADFPSIKLGKSHVVEESALIDWCKQKRD